MAELALVKATSENGLMARVLAAWDKQAAAHKLPPAALDAIRNYEGQLQPGKDYGVYIVCQTSRSGGGAPYEGLVHINRAYPKSPKPILRLIWSRLAPKYEWSDDPVTDHARIFSAVIGGALRLSQSELTSSEVKLYLPGHIDRAYGKGLAASLTMMPDMPFDTRVRGNWLHFEWK